VEGGLGSKRGPPEVGIEGGTGNVVTELEVLLLEAETLAEDEAPAGFAVTDEVLDGLAEFKLRVEGTDMRAFEVLRPLDV